MANSRIKQQSLKKILQSSKGMIADHDLLKQVTKQDRSAETLVLAKFVQAISEIPLIEYKNKIFQLNRQAHKARSYFIMIAYLFGTVLAEKWPEFKKLVPKSSNVTLTHFLNSYCVQTIVHDKLTSYNTQMNMLLDFLIKKGQGKKMIYDKVIMEHIVGYFPSLALNWIWIFNEIVKETRPRYLVQSTLSEEKALGQMVKIVKKVAKDCDLEVQRLRIDSGPGPASSAGPANWADVAASKCTKTGEPKSNQLVTETIPLDVKYFPGIQGRNGATLAYIEKTSGAVVILGKTKNGQSGFLVTGTTEQNDEAIQQILQIIEEKDEADSTSVAQKDIHTEKNHTQIIPYSADILEKYVMDRDCLTALGRISEKYPETIVKVEPNHQRLTVTGKKEHVELVTEYLRDVVSDFAADVVKRRKALPTQHLPDMPITQPFSGGPSQNPWINANKEMLLDISTRNHVSLSFTTKKTSSLTLSGKLKFVQAVDLAICQKIALLKRNEAKVKAPVKPEKSPEPGIAESTTSTADKKEKIDWFEKSFKDKVPENHKQVTSYEDMALKDLLLSAVYSYGLDKPSTVHSILIPLLLAGTKVLIDSPLGDDVCSAICISIIQHIDPLLAQTQGLILVRDKLLTSRILKMFNGLAVNLSISTTSLNTPPDTVPHLVCTTPGVLTTAIDDEVITVANVKVVAITDVQETVGSFGYLILDKTHFGEEFYTKPRLILQSSELADKTRRQLDKLASDMLRVVSIDPKDVTGNPLYIIEKKGGSPEKVTQSRLNNLAPKQLQTARNNMYLVYNVTKDYPNVTVTKGEEDEILLCGKTAEVNIVKTRIQELIILHEKTNNNDQVITKIVSLAPTENGYIYRNREVVEKLTVGYNISIEYAPYENDNISITGTVDVVNTVHKLISDGVKTVMAANLGPENIPLPTEYPAALPDTATPPSAVLHPTSPTTLSSNPTPRNLTSPTPTTIPHTTPTSPHRLSNDLNSYRPSLRPPTSSIRTPNEVIEIGNISIENNRESETDYMPSSRPPGSFTRRPNATSRPPSQTRPPQSASALPQPVRPTPESRPPQPPPVSRPPQPPPEARLPQPQATSLPQPVSQNGLTHHSTIVNIPEYLPGMAPGSPEHWMFGKIRQRMMSSGSSITISELVNMFVAEFPAAREQRNVLLPSFLKTLKAKPLVFDCKIVQNADGKKNIEIRIKLPRRIPYNQQSLPPTQSYNQPPNKYTPLPPEVQPPPEPRQTFPLPNTTPPSSSPLNPTTISATDPNKTPLFNIPTNFEDFLLSPNDQEVKLKAEPDPLTATSEPTSVPSSHVPTSLPEQAAVVPEPSSQTPDPQTVVTTESVDQKPSVPTETVTSGPSNEDSTSGIPASGTSEVECPAVPLSPQTTSDVPPPNTTTPLMELSENDVLPPPTPSQSSESITVITDVAEEEPQVALPEVTTEELSTSVTTTDEISAPNLTLSALSPLAKPFQHTSPSETNNNSLIVLSENDVLSPQTHVSSESPDLRTVTPDHADQITPDPTDEMTPPGQVLTPDTFTPDMIPSGGSDNSSDRSNSVVSLSDLSAFAKPYEPARESADQQTSSSPEFVDVVVQNSEPMPPSPDPASGSPNPAPTTPDPAPTTPDPAPTTPDPAPRTPDPASAARNASRSEHSSGSDYILCRKSESDISSCSVIDSISVKSSLDAKEDLLGEAFDKLALETSPQPSEPAEVQPSSDHISQNLTEATQPTSSTTTSSAEIIEEEDEDEDIFRTLYHTEKRSISSIGQTTAVGAYVNINISQPGFVYVTGGDMISKYSVIKQMVDVWVTSNLPVFVISPKLETVSLHKNVDFYPFKTLTGNVNSELVSRCEEFLASSDDLKLLVINTTHRAINTDDFLTRLTEEYFSFNVVVVTIVMPDNVECLTAVVSSWKRTKNDDVWSEICRTHDLGDISLEKIKRGQLMGLALDSDEIRPVYFTSLLGK